MNRTACWSSLVVAGAAACASGQSINVDFGTAGTAPTAWYGAAGDRGV